MLKWPSILGGGDKLSSEEIARLSELGRELADDYNAPNLPSEIIKAAESADTKERYFTTDLQTDVTIAAFVYMVARDVVPLLRRRRAAKGYDEASVEAELIKTAEDSLVAAEDPPALKVKKRGLIRRIVAGFVRKD